jgi:hypothetical protein
MKHAPNTLDENFSLKFLTQDQKKKKFTSQQMKNIILEITCNMNFQDSNIFVIKLFAKQNYYHEMQALLAKSVPFQFYYYTIIIAPVKPQTH